MRLLQQKREALMASDGAAQLLEIEERDEPAQTIVHEDTSIEVEPVESITIYKNGTLLMVQPETRLPERPPAVETSAFESQAPRDELVVLEEQPFSEEFDHSRELQSVQREARIAAKKKKKKKRAAPKQVVQSSAQTVTPDIDGSSQTRVRAAEVQTSQPPLILHSKSVP